MTLGLPIVRTSVDHGTAFDIAGKGMADPESMIAAVLLAARLARRLRRHYVRSSGQCAPSADHDMTEKTERELAQTNIAENRKAFHDYHLLETFEAGIVLLGTEVKAIREGRVNLRDSFARVEDGEVFLYNVNISPYSHRGYADHEPLRRRKLLLHRDEIRKLIGKTVEKGHDARARPHVFQERPRQGGGQPGQGQEGLRQARDDQAARDRPRDARRRQISTLTQPLVVQ